MKKLIKIPGLGDRVLMAAGEDLETGTHKLVKLLDRIACGQEPLLTADEQESLKRVRAGAFKRQRGQSHKRAERALDTEMAIARYHELRTQGLSGKDAIATVTSELPISDTKLSNAISRSARWSSRRRKK